MLDIFLEPAKIFIKGGFDQFKLSKEMGNFRIAVIDRILREASYNRAIIDEMNRIKKDGSFLNDEETRIALVLSLRTAAFDEVNSGGVPLSLIMDGLLDKTSWPAGRDYDRYLKYLGNTNTKLELTERTYHRIHIVKTLATCKKLNFDSGYVGYLLAMLTKELKSGLPD